ncbi:WalW protein [Sphingomonas sp. 1P06PA]|uniref:WalW protein n=1 Tax=Sphingomonas sp. 1P06PA TaxID=554121 RepID=UPI0039A669FA
MLADAEEEFDWERPLDRSQTATTSLVALPAANLRFNAMGVVPTWMIDWPVAEAGDAIVDLVTDDRCDVGAQLHPWVTPPHEEEVNRHNSFAGNLAIDLERAKITALTGLLARRFGRSPLAFRAGRYGVGPNTGRLIAEAGYGIDVSTRPLFDYSAEGGPDFSDHPVRPWWAGPLLEVPLSVAMVGAMRRRVRFPRLPSLRGVLARTRLAQRVPLTPEDVPLADALDAIEALIDDGVQLFSLSFHTPSLVPGHTPYVRDAGELATFWAWWDGVFDRFARHGIAGARPQDILAAARRG